MRRLTVLFDVRCGFCVTCRWWLAAQPQIIPLEFVAAGSPDAARRFASMGSIPAGELTVVDDDGGIYYGSPAFLMCLYALEDYRELALRLSSPALMPLARRLFEIISENRGRISRWLGLASGEDLVETLQRSAGSPSAETDARPA